MKPISPHRAISVNHQPKNVIEVLILTKSFVLNVENLNTDADAAKIKEYFKNVAGVVKVDIEMSLKLVSLHYNEEVGSAYKLLTAFDTLGYPVR